MFADKSLDLEEQYDKIYRYCYFKVRRQEVAEDITQETFLRFFERFGHYGNEWTLQYLYRIAHNLCVDEYKKSVQRQKREVLTAFETEPHDVGIIDSNCGNSENTVLTRIIVKDALSVLSEEEKEILLLRYVNEVPVSVICQLLRISRFALYRRTQKSLQKLQDYLREEDA